MADFYAARDSTMPPLPWPSIAPPITGGLGIVFLAIVIDRVSQSFGTSSRDRGHKKWHETGPVGLVRGLLRKG